MSSVILNSNQNSAFIATAKASESAYIPNVYSTMPIVTPYAMTTDRLVPTNGATPVSGRTTTFTISKYGIVSQLILSFDKTITQTSNSPNQVGSPVLPPLDWFNCVEKVELLSSSRTVSILTAQDILAQFSNLPNDKLIPLLPACLSQVAYSEGTNPNPLSDTNRTTTFENRSCVLRFGFMATEATQLAANFLEPLTVRVTWNNLTALATPLVAPVTADISLVNPTLMVRYKTYPEESFSKILAENYNAPTLNMLSSRFEDENRASITSVVGANKIKVDLKNTEAVQDFYCVLLREESVGSGVLDMRPQPITNVLFKGSGQDIINQNANELSFAKITDDGFSIGQNAVDNGTDLVNIKKIQTGVYSDDQMLTNTLSLRQINGGYIEVDFVAADARAYYLYICENCSTIYSVSSSTGSLTQSLSN